MPTVYNRIDENRNKTILFVFVFFVFLFIVAYIVDLLFFKSHFISSVFLISLVIVTLGDYIFSDKLILKKNKAFRLDYEKNKKVYKIVEDLCVVAGLPMPKLYATNDLAINAFTIGIKPEKASMIFTAGALKRLDRLELEGVISHELAHIKNNDILLSTILVFLLGFVRSIVDLAKRFVNALIDVIDSSGNSFAEMFIRMFAFMLFYGFLLFVLLLILVLSFIPIIEELVFYKISRKREFLADAEGALLTRYPRGLANALRKIAADRKPLKTVNSSTAHLYIASPFKDKLESFWARLFHSHPPIEKRIRILEEMDEYGDIKIIP